MKKITKQIEAKIFDSDNPETIVEGTLELTLTQLSDDLHPEIQGTFTIADYIPEISDKTTNLRLPSGYEGEVLLSISGNHPPSRSLTTYKVWLSGSAWVQNLRWFDDLE